MKPDTIAALKHKDVTFEQKFGMTIVKHNISEEKQTVIIVQSLDGKESGWLGVALEFELEDYVTKEIVRRKLYKDLFVYLTDKYIKPFVV